MSGSPVVRCSIPSTTRRPSSAPSELREVRRSGTSARIPAARAASAVRSTLAGDAPSPCMCTLVIGEADIAGSMIHQVIPPASALTHEAACCRSSGLRCRAPVHRAFSPRAKASAPRGVQDRVSFPLLSRCTAPMRPLSSPPAELNPKVPAMRVRSEARNVMVVLLARKTRTFGREAPPMTCRAVATRAAPAPTAAAAASKAHLMIAAGTDRHHRAFDARPAAAHRST